MEPIALLCRLSAAARTDIVQGAGGNSSVKEGNILYIKASGTLLKDLDPNKGWTTINLTKWQKEFANFRGNEEEFNTLTDNCTTGKERSSIETGLHALLPQKFVLHTHSAYSCAFLCSGRIQELYNYLYSVTETDIFTVEACAPGLQLTQNLNKAIKKRCTENSIILLQNHGIAIASGDIDKIFAFHQEAHENLQKKFQLPLFIQPVLNDDLKWDAASYRQGIDLFLQRPGILFPDQAVYVDNKISDRTIEFQGTTIAFNNHQRKNAQNTAEILALVLYLYQIIPPNSLNFLDESVSRYIASMSREKYRQNLEKL